MASASTECRLSSSVHSYKHAIGLTVIDPTINLVLDALLASLLWTDSNFCAGALSPSALHAQATYNENESTLSVKIGLAMWD